MENLDFLTPETAAAIVGALAGFLLAIVNSYLWQIFLDRKNRVQLTWYKTIEIPLSIAKKDLKEKLSIYYNNKQVEDIYYTRILIKNTGRKTIKKQIFTCTFHEKSRPIDTNFPRLSTIPEKEVPTKNITDEDPTLDNKVSYRYMVETLGVNQSVQIDFLRDGALKDCLVSFRANEFDEVKTIEGSQSTDPNLELNIVQMGFNIFMYIAILKVGGVFNFIGGNVVAIFIALPFLYTAFIAFKKVVPLLLERVWRKSDTGQYQITMTGDYSGAIIGDRNAMLLQPIQDTTPVTDFIKANVFDTPPEIPNKIDPKPDNDKKNS